jgi:hypothetical protein
MEIHYEGKGGNKQAYEPVLQDNLKVKGTGISFFAMPYHSY